MFEQSTYKALWRHLTALQSQLCIRQLHLEQWQCHFGTNTGYVLKILKKYLYRVSKELVMLNSTEISLRTSEKPQELAFSMLHNHNIKLSPLQDTS